MSSSLTPATITYYSTLDGYPKTGAVEALRGAALQKGALDKCQKIALGVLLLLTLSGALSFFVKGGGPFITLGAMSSCIALGTLSFGIASVMQRSRIREQELHDLQYNRVQAPEPPKAPLSHEEILQAIEEPNASIPSILNQLAENERKPIICWVYSHCLGIENTEPLTSTQETVLSAFNALPLQKEDLPPLSTLSIYKLLNMDSFWSPHLNTLRRSLIDPIISLNPMSGVSLVHYPLALSMLFQDKPPLDWCRLPQSIIPLYTQMKDDQKAAFLECMRRDPARFGYPQEVVNARRKRIAQIITHCASVPLSTTDPRSAPPPEKVSLLLEMAKWPQMDEPLEPLLSAWLDHYATQSEGALPEVIQRICADCPRVLAKIQFNTTKSSRPFSPAHPRSAVIKTLVEKGLSEDGKTLFKTTHDSLEEPFITKGLSTPGKPIFKN